MDSLRCFLFSTVDTLHTTSYTIINTPDIGYFFIQYAEQGCISCTQVHIHTYAHAYLHTDHTTDGLYIASFTAQNS